MAYFALVRPVDNSSRVSSFDFRLDNTAVVHLLIGTAYDFTAGEVNRLSQICELAPASSGSGFTRTPASSLRLSDLADVDLSGVVQGQSLGLSGTSKWTPWGTPHPTELWAYGDSLMIVSAVPTIPTRVGRALGLADSAIHNRSVDGSGASYDEDPGAGTFGVIGGAVRVLQDFPGSAAAAPFQNPRAFGSAKMAMLRWGINDRLIGEVLGMTASQSLMATQGALRAALSRLRASRVDEGGGGIITFGAAPGGGVGAWTGVSNTLRNSGGGYHTQTNSSGGTLAGSAVSYPLPAGYQGEPVFIGLIAHPDSVGVVWTIKIDGVTAATLDLTTFPSQFGNYSPTGVRLDQVPPTATTITATPSIPAGKTAMFDYVNVEAAWPGQVMVLGSPRWPAATYAIFQAGGAPTFNDAALDAVDTGVAAVVAEFDSSIAFVPMADTLNHQRSLYDIHASPAGIHLSNAGAARAAARCITAYLAGLPVASIIEPDDTY